MFLTNESRLMVGLLVVAIANVLTTGCSSSHQESGVENETHNTNFISAISEVQSPVSNIHQQQLSTDPVGHCQHNLRILTPAGNPKFTNQPGFSNSTNVGIHSQHHYSENTKRRRLDFPTAADILPKNVSPTQSVDTIYYGRGSNEIYGESHIFNKKYQNNYKDVWHGLKNDEDRENFFRNEICRILGDRNNIKSFCNSWQLKKMEQFAKKHALMNYPEILICYVRICSKKIALEPEVACDIWNLLSCLINHKIDTKKSSRLLSGKSLIACFYLSISPNSYGTSNVYSLENRIRAEINEIKSMPDWLANGAIRYFSSDNVRPLGLYSFPCTLLHLSAILAHPLFATKMAAVIFRSTDHRGVAVLKKIYYDAFTSFYFMNSFIEMLNGINQLWGKDDKIHDVYLEKLNDCIKKAEWYIFKTLRTNMKSQNTVEILYNLLYNSNMGSSKGTIGVNICSPEFYEEIVLGIHLIMHNWCKDIENSSKMDVKLKTYNVVVVLGSMLSLFVEIHVLFRSIFDYGNSQQQCDITLQAEVFSGPLFNSFDQNTVGPFISAFLSNFSDS